MLSVTSRTSASQSERKSILRTREGCSEGRGVKRCVAGGVWLSVVLSGCGGFGGGAHAGICGRGLRRAQRAAPRPAPTLATRSTLRGTEILSVRWGPAPPWAFRSPRRPRPRHRRPASGQLLAPLSSWLIISMMSQHFSSPQANTQSRRSDRARRPSRAASTTRRTRADARPSGQQPKPKTLNLNPKPLNPEPS